MTADDPSDIRSFSGTHYFMSRALQEHCGDVHHLGRVKPWVFTALRMRGAASRLFTKKRYQHLLTLPLARSFARIFSSKLRQGSYDVIFAPAASTEIALLETDIPIIYTSLQAFDISKTSFNHNFSSN